MMYFKNFFGKVFWSFFDDILVYSGNFKEHLHHLEAVLCRMRHHQLFAKLSKCTFGQQQLEYLGHIISNEGVATDPSKIQVMKSWPTPTTVKQLRGFLGLTGYYRRFVKGYGEISRPLTLLLKKGAFTWSNQADAAFVKLKDAMYTTPFLALHDYSLPFIIEADASGKGIGAVLMQQGRPIAYFSQGLAPKHQSLSTYEKELLVIVKATEKWHIYLQGHHCIIRTDHQSLKYMLEQRMTTLMQQKWLAKLLGLDYEIVYKKGRVNSVADALSRLLESDFQANISDISTVQYGWLADVLQIYDSDATAQAVIQGIAEKKEAFQDYLYSQGLIKYQQRIYVGNNGDSRQKILWELHDGPVGGHSGQEVTLKRISQFFYWPNMRQEVIKYVQSCDVCQRIKTGNQFPQGLLQPLPVPQQIWEDISLDFVEGLPNSNGKDCIMVVIDKFTKVGHFIALTHSFNATHVAQLFLDNVFKLHGMPKSMVSDRDKLFTSNFWKELFNSMVTQLCMSTSYHPQTDGQTERLNRCLEQYLRAMASQRPK